MPGGHWRQTVHTGDGTKTIVFDGLWRPLVEATFDAGNDPATRSEVVKRYNVGGQLAFQSYPIPSVWNYATVTQGTRTFYDGLDRPIRVEEDSDLGVLAGTTEYLPGFTTRTTNPRGKQTLTEYLTYDQPATDWPVKITAPAAVVTEIQRDSLGNPKVLVRRSADNSIHSERYYVYDPAMRLCKTIEPETGTTVMDYDLAGNVAYSAAGLDLPSLDSATCANSDRPAAQASARAVWRGYDSRNRLTTLTFSDHRGDQVWTYTEDGLPAQIVTDNGDGVAINAYHYNARRMLAGQGETIEQQGWYTWGFGEGYDHNGNVAVHVYPGGETVSYAPNALGQPTQVTSSLANYATGIAYFPNGALKSFTYGNGLVHQMHQNTRQLPDHSWDSYGGVSVLDDSYLYDATGNVGSITDGLPGARGNRSMGYDDLDRLSWTTSAMFGGSANYWYDVLDNLTHVSIGGAKARDQYYCYDTGWHLTNIKTGSCASGPSIAGLGYDLQGNLQNKNGRIFNFDYGNRLRTIVDAGATLEAYRYDGHGRRILQWNPSGNILSMYGQDGVLRYQENGRTGKLTNYLYLSGSLIATNEQTIATGVHAVQYQHTDALGTPVVVTDAARNVVERSEYEPYGQLLNRPIKDGPGYTGHVSDALSGLTYMQQRYYDPGIGGFLSVDPVGIDSNAGSFFNRYNYAANSPYGLIDPDGRAIQDPRPKPTPPPAPCSAACMKIRNTVDHGGTRGSSNPKSTPPTVGGFIKDRSSFTAEVSGALGGGVTGSATKQVGKPSDSVKGSFVVGEGAVAAATYNFKIWSSGGESSNGLAFTADPSSYLKVKLAAGIAFGFSVEHDPHGNTDVSISIGGGLGEEVVYKPPVTIGVNYNLDK